MKEIGAQGQCSIIQLAAIIQKHLTAIDQSESSCVIMNQNLFYVPNCQLKKKRI